MEDKTVVVVGTDPTAFDDLVGKLEDRTGSIEARRLHELGDLFEVLCRDVVHCLVLPESVGETSAVDVARGVRGLYPDLPVVVCGQDDSLPTDLDVIGVDADSTDDAAVADAVAGALAGGVDSDAARPPSRMETLLLSMFDQFPVHLYAKDEAARHVMVSRHANEPTDLIGITDLEYEELPAEHREASYRDEMDVIENEEPRLEVEEYTDFVDAHTLTSKVPWYGPDRDVVGLVGHTQDITERKQREHASRRQHELLVKVALVVAHELRNELQVAHGRLELAEDDPDQLEVVERSQRRLARIVDEVIQLASAERVEGERKPIWLSTLAREVWATLPTADADLSVEDDARIVAEPESASLLLQVLLENAVTHGGPDLTVTVGATEDGFYVADDGDGIALDPPTRVFDAGSTTDEDATGFGLYVARTVADEQGWTISVGERGDGGARFDVTGVDRVA